MFALQGALDLDPSNLTKVYVSLCATPTDLPNTAQQSQQQVADLYGKGLAAAAELQKQAVKPDTVKLRQSAIRELADWLQSKQAACNRTVHTAIPEDILVYLTQHWLPSHAGSITSNGELIAAPGSMSSIQSHLSSEFEVLGRTDDWNPATQTGNPIQCPNQEHAERLRKSCHSDGLSENRSSAFD